MTNLDSILKSRDITLPTKVCLIKAMVFPVVMYGCESWTVKKAEHRRIDAFELWYWRKLLRVPWTARRSNQSILKEISPGNTSFPGQWPVPPAALGSRWLDSTHQQNKPQPEISAEASSTLDPSPQGLSSQGTTFTSGRFQFCCCCCSVTQTCPTLCDTMDCSTPGFSVPHHLPEFAQVHVQ